MTNTELNKYHRGRMKGTCSEAVQFDWQDGEFMDFLLGGLPVIRKESLRDKAQDKYHRLEKAYRTYSFFSTDKEKFFSDIKELVNDVKQDVPYWYGLNPTAVEDVLNMHKCCLISGEGGIGKSYFIKCFEQELEKRGTKHLCLYGKFIKDIEDIDFDEIKEAGKTEEYVFVFDAINEIADTAQIVLLEKVKKILKTRGVRVVLTYRIHTVDDTILNQFREIAGSLYEFPGVSFESAIEWLRKTPVVDISEYIDVLYSNNPALLSKLKLILQNDFSEDPSKNNISRYTYIYEHYIKRSLDLETWKKTKAISKRMYENGTKSISVTKIGEIIDKHDEYIAMMEQMGFLSHFSRKGMTYCSFVIDTLADYLIARYMWEDLSGLDTKACIAVIEKKLDAFYGLQEMLILLLFDKFSPDYKKIRDILRETKLIERLDQDTLVKVHFRPEDISAFQKFFVPRSHKESLLYFAGYVNKPFNCTNYLNQYYLENDEKQIKELTKLLSRKHTLGMLRSRLKNALYYICKCECTENRSTETFYAALWCSSAGNVDIRKLATKLLFEVLQRNDYLVAEAISIFPKIKDHYIQDALIHALSMCPSDKRITSFLDTLWNQVDFTMAKSIRRMSEYLGRLYEYINLVKDNIFDPNADCVSETFKKFLHRIDLMEKELLPFRFWSVDSFQHEVKFLSADKGAIKDFNERVTKEFTCVRDGDCNGRMDFQNKAEEYFGVSFADDLLDGKAFLASLEKVFSEVFRMYGLPFDADAYLKQDERDFDVSIFRKCTCIAIDIFYGSLMCNYYSTEFGTYNNYQDSIGYEVYDPLEYGDGLNIKSPLSIYQPNVEKMGNLLLNKLDLSGSKDEQWWSDLNHTKRNILNLLSPVVFDGFEWIMIACRISVQDSLKKHEWREAYDWFCCTSSEETLHDDGEERYLTIELKDYTGNIFEYGACTSKPWLCKSVPNIAHDSGLLEDTVLVLPPAQIVDLLKLTVNLEEMSWQNEDGERIIICNNNRSSYFHDPIMGTVFIRKDAYEELQKILPIKFFAFSEKYLNPKGYCDDSAYHFEICDGQIVKSVANYQRDRKGTGREVPQVCQNCKYGFYKPYTWDENSPLAQFLKMYNTETEIEDEMLWDTEDEEL